MFTINHCLAKIGWIYVHKCTEERRYYWANWIAWRSSALLYFVCNKSVCSAASFVWDMHIKRPNFLARQTLATWAKLGQLLCIPDKVMTLVSGKNERGLNSVSVYSSDKTSSYLRCQDMSFRDGDDGTLGCGSRLAAFPAALLGLSWIIQTNLKILLIV